MSKNYELLQQANFTLNDAPTLTAENKAVAAENTIPATSSVLSFVDTAAREEALKLVQRLFLSPDGSPPRAVLFAGVDSNNGCNWLSAITAKLLAKSVSGSVCIVEGNLRSPSLAAQFGADPDRGLADALRQSGSIRQFTTQIGSENLWLLSSGAPFQDATIFLNSDCMKDRITELRKEFDFVVMNAPSLSAFADAALLGRFLDGVVLVLEANSTRREAAVRVTESLRAANIRVLGAVLNNRTFPIPAVLYNRL